MGGHEAIVVRSSASMTPELIGIITVGVALAGLILATVTPMRSDINQMKRDISGLCERMARIEGLFEGFTGRQPEPGSTRGP